MIKIKRQHIEKVFGSRRLDYYILAKVLIIITTIVESYKQFIPTLLINCE